MIAIRHEVRAIVALEEEYNEMAQKIQNLKKGIDTNLELKRN